MATRKDLELAVKRLNDSYMKREPNVFEVGMAYGGYRIDLTGKSKKVGKNYVYTGLGTAVAALTSGYGSATDTLAQLGLIISNKDAIKRFIIRFKK